MTVKAFIARLAQYPEDALCCGTFWLADDFPPPDDTLTEDDIDSSTEQAQDSPDANDGLYVFHLRASSEEAKLLFTLGCRHGGPSLMASNRW